jgi:D-amino peptidase
MMQGIDESVDGVFFIGYHARNGTPNAVLDHTWSSKTVANVWLTDILTGEYGLNAALAGHFGVSVIMATGDQIACAQTSTCWVVWKRLLSNKRPGDLRRSVYHPR